MTTATLGWRVLAAACWLVWLAAPAAGDEDGTNSCPAPHRDLKIEEIREKKVRPYIFGGPALPSCKNCEMDSSWIGICQFEPGVRFDICSKEQQATLLDLYLNKSTWNDLLTLNPCQFWPFLQNRTLWIIGDSQGHALYMALHCFLVEFWESIPDNSHPLNEDHEKANKPQCTDLVEGARLCFILANGIEPLSVVLPTLTRFPPNDIVLFNAGIWHNDPAEYEVEFKKLETLLAKYDKCYPYMVWVDSSMQHFDTADGSFGSRRRRLEQDQKEEEEEAVDKEGESGGKKEGVTSQGDDARAVVASAHPNPEPWCKPLAGVSFDHETHHTRSIDPEHLALHGGWRNRVARAAMKRLKIPVVETWNSSLELWTHHRLYQDLSVGDCTHYCQPSAPQVWVWHMYNVLHERAKDIAAWPASLKPAKECENIVTTTANDGEL